MSFERRLNQKDVQVDMDALAYHSDNTADFYRLLKLIASGIVVKGNAAYLLREL